MELSFFFIWVITSGTEDNELKNVSVAKEECECYEWSSVGINYCISEGDCWKVVMPL